MLTNITITRNPDPLVRWTWSFWYYGDRHALVLDDYMTLTRPSLRHKFRVDEFYRRLDQRDNSIAEADVVFPADVIAEVRARFSDELRVVKWSEVKR